MSTFDDFMVGEAVSKSQEILRLQDQKRALIAALRHAHTEIHNPGSGRTMGIDVNEIIEAALEGAA